MAPIPHGFSRRQSLAAAACLLGGAWPAGRAMAQALSDKSHPGLLLGPGPAGWWDSERVSSPRVLRAPDGSWKMWYYGRDPAFDPDVGLPTGRIGLALSRDGLSWQRVRGPLTMGAVLEPSANPDRFDSSHVGVSSVTRVGDEYVMWYFGGDQTVITRGTFKAKGFPLRAGRATSRDGLMWQKTDGPYKGALIDVGVAGSYDAAFIGWPQLLQDGDGWKLYYHTADPAQGFLACLATSQDGLTWQKVGPVLSKGAPGDFDAGGCASRHVIKHAGRYLMFYEGNGGGNEFGGLGLAESKNGVDFAKIRGRDAKGAILAKSPAGSGLWDAGGVGTPWAVPMPDGSIRLYYVGASESANKDPTIIDRASIINRIGLAVGHTDDLLRWKRWQA